jgi:glycosyltransferase involved in cell wall biosynthesis
MRHQLTAIIIAKNEARHIADCVASLRWADEVVVCDNFSGDQTVALGQQAGARVIPHFPHENFAQAHNLALDTVTDTEWVLFVDADERATPQLAAEIQAVVKGNLPPAGYWVPRHNYIFGKLTLHAGYYPDYQMRLLRRSHARYERPVHEVVVLDGSEGYLKHPLIHYNYETVEQFHVKQRRYIQFDAQELDRQGIHFKPRNLILQPLRHFWWRYVALQGYRDGLHGLRLCALLAYYYGLLTYLQLRQVQRRPPSDRSPH